jgi:magnesium-transporting ATPase (P-type)
VSSGSVIASLWENISNNNKIRKMARYSCPIEVRLPSSDGELISNNAVGLKEIDSSDLVPGDLVKVP